MSLSQGSYELALANKSLNLTRRVGENEGQLGASG